MDDLQRTTVLKVLSIVDICTFGSMLMFAVRNSYEYLWNQSRFGTYYLTTFYATVILTGIFRVICFSC